ncbi:MAG: AAA family ATPase [Cyanobacteria bacterium J06639_16]
MEDFGCISLGQYAKTHSLSWVETLAIALQIAAILHDLYQNRVIHKDIKPGNILIHPESKQVKLIDFSIASLLPKETQEIQNPNVLEGTLAYLAPEQTGRMNRGIDYRADFYGLGVTLYELLTGELPFQSEDPLGLVHCHIAKSPVPPHQINKTIPTMVSDIVLKLMAKNAEDRYQSALGLKHDLEHCLTQWNETGKISEFELGQRDISDRFLIPEKLYGRAQEVQTLLNAFERVATGNSEMMLVAGFSGIGKTAVINEVHKPITRQQGYFIKGKFDQFNRNLPLSAFIQALRDLMGQLLAESDLQLSQWRHKLLEAVGENGQVLIDVIPELEKIIGPQPSASELSGTAARNQFNLLIQKFIAVFTTTEHPLVMFLDDLQWADSASIQLIKLLMDDQGHLLLLGAYRDNEVSPIHPFMLMVEDLQKADATVSTIKLTSLTLEDTNQLVANTLNCSTQQARPLTDLVMRKTQGNPFFATQFLKALYENKQITFDHNQGYWECDIAQINEQSLTDDVIVLMAQQLQKLPTKTQQIIKLAACVGNQFDLATLAIISEQSSTDTAAALWSALQEGLVFPTNQIYKFFQDAEHSKPEKSVNSTYRFLHDRIQQAAYCLIPEAQKQTTHLKIGRLLLNSVSAANLEDKIFNIVNHWNMGAALVKLAAERCQLCQLNLTAARKAKRATAYDMANQYAVTGLNLMASDSWQADYDLMLASHELAAESAYLNGDFAQSQQWAEILLEQARTLLDEVKVHEINFFAYVAQQKLLDAITIGLHILERLGISIPTTPTDTDIQQALADTATLIPQTQIQSLLDLPRMTDAHALAALRILNSMAATVYFAQPKLMPLIISAQIKLSILHGNAPMSAAAYVRYGFILCGKINDIESGYEFGRLALKLSEQFSDKEISTRVLLMVGALTLPWKIHLREGIPLLQAAYSVGLESGNLDGAALSHYYESQSSYLVGQELHDLAHKVSTHSQQIRQINQELHFNNNELLRQVIVNLTSRSKKPYQLMGEAFDETRMLPQYRASSNILGLYCLYLHKLMLCYWFGEEEAGVEYATLATKYLAGSTAQATVPLLYFYDSLARLTRYVTASKSEQESVLARVTENQEKLKYWAQHAPMNFQHKYDLVLAERHHYLGQKVDAIDWYDRAITGAKVNGYIQEEALANECAAKFYLGWGKGKIAAFYIQEAYYCYVQWGAKTKVQDLERRYPRLLAPILQQQQIALSATETVFATSTLLPQQAPDDDQSSTSGSNSISATLDLETILKASQALSSEIQLDKLLATLLHTVLENAGADKGALLMPHKQQWFVEAVATVNRPTQTVATALSQSSAVPQALINTVRRNLEPVVIVDATTHPTLASDTYIIQQQPKSLLCTPILQQGKLVAILYLENQFTVGAFTRDRVELLNFLCAQAAISLKNSFLYQDLENSLQDAQQKSHDLAEVIALSNGQQRILELIVQGVPLNTILEETARHIEIQTQHPAYCSFLQLDAEGQLRHLAAPSLPANYNALIDGLAIGPEVGSCGTAAYYKASVTVNNIATDPLWAKYQIALDYGLRACASTPILGAEGQVLATLAMYQPEAGEFTPRDRKLMESATYLARIAIERHQADIELRNLNFQVIQAEKMASLGNLVAGVAHEINNPIGFLNGSISNSKDYVRDLLEYIELYQQHHANAAAPVQEKAEEIDLEFLSEDLPKLLDSMQGATHRIKSISTSLRTFSRADAEHTVKADLHEGLDSTLLILKYRLKANENRPAIEVVQDYGELPSIECFPGQLNQVFMNILANAIDVFDEAAQQTSFAQLKDQPQKITITTAVLPEQGAVEIRIRDNGTGMSESVSARVFDHLYTTKGVGKGTGLGLAIAHQIVTETHGGRLDVQSELYQGTEFSIRLPISG